MAQRNCTLFPDDPHLCDIIVAVRTTAGSLSFVGCLFIIIVTWLFKKYQIFSQRLILYLSIAAFLDSISYFLPGFVPDGTLCEFQAFWLSFFDWAVLLWACCITFNLFQNAIRAVRTERFEIAYHVVSWGLPFAVSCLPFIGDHYGPAGIWCWIDFNSSHSQIWRFTTWYIPMWILLTAMLITYVYVVVKLRREVSRWEGTYRAEDERQKEMLKKDIKRLRAYPLIYMTLAVFPSINRIQNAIHDDAVFWLMLMHVICWPLQGAANALAFAFDRETLQLLTWTSVKEAFVQRIQLNTHLITEYAFAQTTGSSSSSAGSDNCGADEETAGQENPPNVDEKPGTIVREGPSRRDQTFPADSVRERNALGKDSNQVS